MFNLQTSLPVKILSVACIAALLGSKPVLADHNTGAPSGLYTTFDGNLADIISSLYGGDGIMVQTGGSFDHSADFVADSLVEFSRLSRSVRNLSFPSINAMSSVQYRYDSVLDEFVPRTTSLSSSIFAFDAETVGAKQFYFGLAYSTRNFSTLGGRSLNDLTVDLNHFDDEDDGPDLPCIGGPPGACHSFEQDVVRLSIDLGLKEEILLLSGIYGLTSNFDVGVIVPLLRTKMSVSSFATIVEDPSAANVPFTIHRFGGDADNPQDALSAQRTGFGDIELRFNYRPSQTDWMGWDIGIITDFRLPTGNEANLQGLPGIGIQPRLAASRTISIANGTLQPHVNLAYGINMGPSREHQFNYVLGGTYTYSWSSGENSVAVSADFLGKHVVRKRDGLADDQYDMSFGLKSNILHSVYIYYNVLLPIDNSGLRPAAQHIWGVQVKF